MRTPAGREAEMRAVATFLREAGDGHARLVLEGEPGIGKTTVWKRAVQMAGDGGFTVLTCAPGQAEAKLAFAALADLLAPAGAQALDALPPPQRVPLEVALLRVHPTSAHQDPRAVATALLTLLRELTLASSVLVAIDDVQWLDAESAAALTFALRRLEDRRRLGLLVAVRTDRGHASDVLQLGRRSAPGLTRLRLGPLRSSALQSVLEAQLGLVLPRPTLHRIEHESGGNPLFALELARALRDCGQRLRPGEPMPVPPDLATLLTARLRTVPEPVQEALLAVALLSHPTATLLDNVLVTGAAEAMETAVRAGLIEVRGEDVRFVHPLYAAAVSGSVLASRRRALHRRLAAVVEDDEERGRHLGLATTAPDEKVATALERAAALARSRGAWGTAADLLERSRELTPARHRNRAARRIISAAEHQLRAGDRPRARELVECVLAEQLPPSRRAHALRILAQLAISDDNVVAAQQALVEALAYADDDGLAAKVEMDLVYLCASLMDFSAGRGHAYRALRLAERAGDTDAVAHARAHCAMLDFLCAQGVDWKTVERSSAESRYDELVPLAQRPPALAALLLLYVGRHDEARTRLESICTAARDAGDESDVAFILIWRSWLETRSGDFDLAAALAEESAALATVTGSPAMLGWALTQRAYVHAHRGELEEARRTCADAADFVRRSGNRLPYLWIAASLTLTALSHGAPDAAWSASATLVEALEQDGIGEPVLPFFLPDALEALIALGALDRAESLLAAFEGAARRLDRAWALATAGRCRAVLLGARGELPAALAALEPAFAALERVHLPFEHARTLLVKGVLERRSGRRASASTSLTAARDAFATLGAPLWAARSSAELERVPKGRIMNARGLSPAQEQVAELAARGQTNREIARRLYVSEKTVEAQLTRIYRTLGLRSRAELAGWMTR